MSSACIYSPALAVAHSSWALPPELDLAIADGISTCQDLASLSASCHSLYDVAFPLLMSRAVNFRMVRSRMTVLGWASKRGYIRVVARLLESGAAVNTLESSGLTSLMHACESGQEEVVECLITNGADLRIISRGETAFTKAARFDHPNIMNIFFRLGEAVDRLHWWTLLSAAHGGKVEVAKLLLENGVDVNFKLTATNETPPCARQYEGRTAIYIAVCYGHSDLVRLLVDNGGNTDAANDYGETALKYLASKWPDLSSTDDRCLLELCGRSRLQTAKWKSYQIVISVIATIIQTSRSLALLLYSLLSWIIYVVAIYLKIFLTLPFIPLLVCFPSLIDDFDRCLWCSNSDDCP